MGDQMFAGSLIIFMDPPKQTRYRNLVSKAFTPARMRALEPRIREIACEHLDRLVGQPRFDVVREFTAKLPMDVISTLLGIPKQDRDQVRGWSNDILHREPGNPMPTKHGFESMAKLHAYLREQIEERRRRPKDDVMTLLIEAEVDGETLDDERDPRLLQPARDGRQRDRDEAARRAPSTGCIASPISAGSSPASRRSLRTRSRSSCASIRLRSIRAARSRAISSCTGSCFRRARR